MCFTVKIVVVFAVVFFPSVLCDIDENLQRILNHIHPEVSAEVQKSAVEGVIGRILPNRSNLFRIQITTNLPQNTFQITKGKNDDYVVIRGSDGVSACKGFHHYLKYYCGCHVSWSGNQLNNFPDQLPIANETKTSASRFIYYQNVCTWSYSFVWWKWEDWRRHIDWMAMMGISLTIAPIQEAIWERVYKDLGLSDDEIDDHFAGPAFQAWQRMGNIRGWAGPLTKSYKDQQLELQKKILKAQRELGMSVAIPAFAGHVPTAFKRIYPKANLTAVTVWNNFPPPYCCPLFVDPSDPLFQTVGTTFLKKVIEEYGTDHIYFSDPFNEILPHKAETEYISKTAQNIYQAMKSVDTNAVWLLQGWMFVTNPFWKDDLIRSFLTTIPTGHLLILDLMSEMYPQYERTNSYYGQPFIWCMLHNFGGTLGMHGSVQIVNSRITLARNISNTSMVGVGITPEGINQNYVMYEFALERGWNANEFCLETWFQQFSRVRYGKEDENVEEAWQILQKSVYSYRGLIKLHGKYSIARRPSLRLSPWTWYDPLDIKYAWKNMLKSNEYIQPSPLYQHDLVDLTRQFLQVKGDQLYINIALAFKSKNATNLQHLSDLMIDLLVDLDRILETSPHFLLGTWLEASKNFSDFNLERRLNEINARNQITSWGPNGQIVDYATKQWAGIVKDLFLPRWKLFLDQLQFDLMKQKSYNENMFRRKVFRLVENPFNVDRKRYSTIPQGDSISVSQEIYTKWENIEKLGILTKTIPQRIEALEIAPTPTAVLN